MEREIVCDGCGVAFCIRVQRGRPRRFCMKSCADRHAHAAEGVSRSTCEQCGGDISRPRPGQKWCSRRCMRTAPGDKRWPQKDCRCCGEMFQPLAPASIFCSDECRKAVATGAKPRRPSTKEERPKRQPATKSPRPTRLELNCDHCGRVVRKWGNSRVKFCSDDCQRKAGMRHQDSIRTINGRTSVIERVLPLRVFKRDNWRCHICGGQTDPALRGKMEPEAPEIDHIIPLSKNGEHTYANVACAHRRCNMKKRDKLLPFSGLTPVEELFASRP